MKVILNIFLITYLLSNSVIYATNVDTHNIYKSEGPSAKYTFSYIKDDNVSLEKHDIYTNIFVPIQFNKILLLPYSEYIGSSILDSSDKITYTNNLSTGLTLGYQHSKNLLLFSSLAYYGDLKNYTTFGFHEVRVGFIFDQSNSLNCNFFCGKWTVATRMRKFDHFNRYAIAIGYSNQISNTPLYINILAPLYAHIGWDISKNTQLEFGYQVTAGNTLHKISDTKKLVYEQVGVMPHFRVRFKIAKYVYGECDLGLQKWKLISSIEDQEKSIKKSDWMPSTSFTVKTLL